MDLYVIDTGNFKLDGGAMFGVVPKTLWQRANPADEDNLCTWALRCLLIEDGDRLILIDNGIGDKQSEKFFSFYKPHGDDSLAKSLRKHGFTEEDVTDVFQTHLHFDHCGGAVKRDKDGNLALNFPNAKYWSNEDHWEWATNPNARERASFLKENIMPIEESGRLNHVPVNGASPFEAFDIIFVDGHTEKMMLPRIRYKDKTIVFMADLLPSSFHIPLAWVMSYDVRPLHTFREKEEFLSEAVENDYYLFFEHDPKTECCNLKKTEKGVRMDESFKLEDII